MYERTLLSVLVVELQKGYQIDVSPLKPCESMLFPAIKLKMTATEV